MIIGILTLTFRLHGNRSLKGKRQVSSSLKQKLRNKFNVSVAEVDSQDRHDKLVLAVVTVGNETGLVEGRLARALSMAEASCPEELTDSNIEIFGADEEETGRY